jgi:hypothetical protein
MTCDASVTAGKELTVPVPAWHFPAVSIVAEAPNKPPQSPNAKTKVVSFDMTKYLDLYRLADAETARLYFEVKVLYLVYM